MQILERGTPPGDVTYVASCPSCRTKFTYKKHEGRIVADQRDGDALVLNCPTCPKEIWLTLSNLKVYTAPNYYNDK